MILAARCPTCGTLDLTTPPCSCGTDAHCACAICGWRWVEYLEDR